jgi:hypothetical protein
MKSRITSFQKVSHGFSFIKSPKQPQSVTFILPSSKGWVEACVLKECKEHHQHKPAIAGPICLLAGIGALNTHSHKDDHHGCTHQHEGIGQRIARQIGVAGEESKEDGKRPYNRYRKFRFPAEEQHESKKQFGRNHERWPWGWRNCPPNPRSCHRSARYFAFSKNFSAAKAVK